MTFWNNFNKVTVQGKFSSKFWELFKPFQGGELGWLGNSVVQSLLPEGDVLREKGIRLMPESIFLSMVVLLHYYSAMCCNPCAPLAFNPELATPAALVEDHTVTGMTPCCFMSFALSPRVQLSPCGA